MATNKDEQGQPGHGMQRHEDMPRKPVPTERPDPTREPGAGQQGQGTPQTPRGPADGRQQGGQHSNPPPGQQGQSGGVGGQQGGAGERQKQSGVVDDVRTDLSRDNPYKS
jgi:hypothetical protein